MKKLKMLSRFVGIKKMLFIMRITLFILVVSLMQVSASVYSQATRLNINLENASFEDILDEIKEQSEFNFLYRSDIFEGLDQLDLKFSDVTLETILDKVLVPEGYAYEIEDNVVVIRKVKQPKIIDEPAEQQQKIINGKVTEKDGNPMVGVSIYVKGTTVGTTTDIDGNYALEIPDDAQTLVFSFIGFETQEVTIGERTAINLVLELSESSLEEVVVVGYGTMKKEQIGSAVAHVKAEEIEMKAIGKVNFEEAIAGQIKGVNIMKESGHPGSKSVINIRGYTTHSLAQGASSPLFVIDGVPIFVYGNEMNVGNPLDAIDPNDIESITVLKDAGATAIYGSNGANGVIIVTTKGGKKNTEVNATANLSYSFNSPTVMLDPLNTNDFKAYQVMVAQNTLWKYNQGFSSTSAYQNAVTIIDPLTGNVRNTVYDNVSGKDIPLFGNEDTDWWSSIYKNYTTSKVANINVNGGSDKTTYTLSATYNNSEPMTYESYYKKYSINLRVDSDVNDWLKLGTSVNISGNTNYTRSSFQDFNGYTPAFSVYNARPDVPVYNEDGSFYYWDKLAWGGTPGEVSVEYRASNPATTNTNHLNTKSKAILSSIYAEAKLFKGFILRADANVYTNSGYHNGIRSKYQNDITSDGLYAPDINDLTKQFTENTNITFDMRGDYNVKIQDHTIDVMFGASWVRNDYTNFSQGYDNIVDIDVLNNASAATSTSGTLDIKRENAMNSFFSRLQYSYKGKYTAVLNFRSDKSSKFGPGNKVAYFPAVALNWNIASEGFMDNAEFVNRLSLRASYGQTGSTNIAEYAYIQVFNPSTRSMSNSYGDLGRLLEIGYSLPNKEIGWESTRELNIGTDFSLFNNRVYGGFDIYSKKTTGVLGSSPFNLETGARAYTANLADLDNKGWEFELGVDIIRLKDILWNVDFNIATNSAIRGAYHGMISTEVLELSYMIGKPLTSIIGYRVEGIIQTKEEIDALNAASPTGKYYQTYTGPGDFKYKDLNGDGQITADDQEIIGDREPDFFGGFNTMFHYKNFSLIVSCQYATGMSLLANDNGMYGSSSLMGNTVFQEVLTDTWRPDNTGAQLPMKQISYGYNAVTSDASLQDNVFFTKVSLIRLDYEIPETFMNKLPINNTMVYVAVSNPFIFTNYKGMDPTTAGYYSGYNSYPTTRTIVLGVKIGL